MKDVIIVSGGNIQRDFALDFLKKNKTEKVDLIAADRGVEFFKGTDWQPEVAVGDFDSLSAEGALYLQGLRETEIMRLKPEKDDSDTQSAVNFAIDRGAERITILGATGNRIDHLMAFRTAGTWKEPRCGYHTGRSVELYETDRKSYSS